MPLPLNENETGVSLILVPHNNHDRLNTRLQRDVLPTIAAHPRWQFQLVVVDNSDADKRPAYSLDGYAVEHTSIWPGSNIMYGPAMNLAIEACIHPYIVYVCSNHGHMYDPTWIDDLIHPLMQNDRIAMTGSLYPSGSPLNMGFPGHLPQVHIQGGVFAAKTAVMRTHPYTSDPRWVHWGSDVYQGFQLTNAGFALHPVASVNSVWRQCVASPEQWKYVHDYSEE